MPRYKLTLEYYGGDFVGWQIQENGPTVQGALEQAIVKYCGERVRVFGAGRTDAGVHALGQVVHVDLLRADAPEKLQSAVNFHLKPAPISIVSAQIAELDFHARFSATARHYRYRIINRRAPLTLERGRAWHIAAPLAADAMHDAAQQLVGHHDFTTFRSSRCQSPSPVKTLDRLDVTRCGEEITIEASARSFLHHQVRSMVGCLAHVGTGKWSGADVAAALAARDRRALAVNAPPQGLYLVGVDYPAEALQ